MSKITVITKNVTYLGFLTLLIVIMFSPLFAAEKVKDSFLELNDHTKVIRVKKVYYFVAAIKIKNVNSSGMILTRYYLASRSNEECKAVNDELWNDFRKTCKSCIRESDECLPYLPPGYEDTKANKPIVFPYVSFGPNRLVISGIPRSEGKQICEEVAADYRKNIDVNAVCIAPSYIPK